MMKANTSPDSSTEMLYDYKTRPRWYLAILLGVQHFITMCVPNAMGTLILVNQLCLDKDSPIKSELITISFFIMGITTMLQTFIGTRLPIIQGSTFALLLPTIGLVTMPDIGSCNLTDNKFAQDRFTNKTMPDSVFHLKMRLIGGSLMISSCVEIFLGASGLLKYLVRIISPLSLASIYTVLALSIVIELINMMAGHWAISLTGTAIMIILTLILAPVTVPLATWGRNSGCVVRRVKIFETSPILISVAVVWILCAILTVSGALTSNPDHYGYSARTDVKLRAIYDADIFRMPYPMRWGMTLIIPSAIIGMSAGILISIVESIGDYMITAEVCKAPKIPEYAICRGIFVEGVGVFLAGLLGSSVGPTSYSDNIGVIKLTRVGNKVIAQVAAIIMMVCGVSPVIGALFVSIPDPAVGGVIIVVTRKHFEPQKVRLTVSLVMILGVGITYLQYVELRSVRNGMIFSLAVAFGLFLPPWCNKNSKMISVGVPTIDETIRILLSISVFIASVLSVFLDNILPGSYKIQKIIEIKSEPADIKADDKLSQMLAYDCFLLKWLAERWKFLQYLPMFPAYEKLKLKNNDAKNNLDLQNL